VESDAELAAHHEVRHRVFVLDQRLFVGNDRDERDLLPGTLHVVGVDHEAIAGVDHGVPVGADRGAVVGAVRLYPLDDGGLWQGDRLAVLPEARVRQLGAQLVRFAVATAGERGGHTMVARIQLPNVRFFEQLGWHADGPAGPYHGVTHQPMAIPLGAR
jgi:putative N-acetyltransferase (TIGR04045 family)